MLEPWAPARELRSLGEVIRRPRAIRRVAGQPYESDARRGPLWPIEVVAGEDLAWTDPLTCAFMVGGRGFEPLTSSVSGKRSPPELTARGRSVYPSDPGAGRRAIRGGDRN